MAAGHEHANHQLLVNVHEVCAGVAPHDAAPFGYGRVCARYDLGVHAPNAPVRLLVVRIARRPVANQFVGTSQTAKPKTVGVNRRHADRLRNEGPCQEPGLRKKLPEFVKQLFIGVRVGIQDGASRKKHIFGHDAGEGVAVFSDKSAFTGPVVTVMVVGMQT